MSALLALALGCGDFERGDPVPTVETPTPTSNGGTATFTADVHPILMEYCQPCHNPSGDASGTDYHLTGDPDIDYDTVLNFVVPGNPNGSRLLTKARGVGHQGGELLPTDTTEYQTLYTWIEDGALQ